MKHIYGCLFLFISSVAMAQTPVMTWDFETIKDGKAIEASTQIADTIEGNFEQVTGVRGKGLRLDGFTTRVIRSGKETVKPPGTPQNELRLPCWIRKELKWTEQWIFEKRTFNRESPSRRIAKTV